ncbi:hypothetical protein niasHT_007638 [Heterodera trifolii]|uniref:Trafficking protein particle complex subunit 11 C-terminal domain-containing protein n=1 Tax=Heterodera trifolii TaxID=157864 RepID=A0ABD2LRG4_9BILA
MVRPQRCNVLLTCPILADNTELELFVDECVQLTLTLHNAECNGTLLKNIWVICHKVCREDEEFTNQQQNLHTLDSLAATKPPIPGVIRRTFVVPSCKGHKQQQQVSIGDGKTTTLLVPMFSQELASLLAPEQSTDFSIRLQSKSNNCISLRVQVCCTLPSKSENEGQALEEPAELVQHFPIRCVDPFEPKIAIFCENGEKAQCLVFGQKFRVQLQLKCNGRVTVHNVHWKLNDAFEHFDALPLDSLIKQHFEKLKISSVDSSEFLNTHSVWMKVTNGDGQSPMKETGQSNGGDEEHQTQLGDVVVEWSSTLSFEHVRSVLALPTMPPILVIPMTLNVELANDNDGEETNEAMSGCCFRILKPFRLKYYLKNTSGGPLAVHLNFEQSAGTSIDGVLEDSFLFFPNDERVIEQCVIPISLGFVNFPRPTVRCVSSISDHADLEFGNEDLEQLNHLIMKHTFNSVPKSLFILPR